MKFKSDLFAGVAALAACFSFMVPAFTEPAQAQSSSIEQEPAGAVELRAAMQRIARNPLDPAALTDAGAASLLLGDPAAAQSFFRRALMQSPRNGAATAGLASALLRSENPFEALKLFDQAVKLGIPESSIAADRGLAFDLIGNFALAQRDYQIAGTGAGHSDTLLRMIVSLGLSGKTAEADRFLVPLLRDNQVAAWRVRAFLLAAQGKPDEALQIARGFLPEIQASQLLPFFRKMNELTAAQKVAAIHFGNFPASAAIGRDSQAVRIAGAATGSPVSGAGRLVPSGTPLGSSEGTQAAGTLVATAGKLSKAELRRRERVDQQARRKDARSSAKQPATAPVTLATSIMPPPPPPLGTVQMAPPVQAGTAARAVNTQPPAQLPAERGQRAMDGQAHGKGVVAIAPTGNLPMPNAVRNDVDRTAARGSMQPAVAAPLQTSSMSTSTSTVSAGLPPVATSPNPPVLQPPGVAMAGSTALSSASVSLAAAGQVGAPRAGLVPDGAGSLPPPALPTPVSSPATSPSAVQAPSPVASPVSASVGRLGTLGAIVAAIEIPPEEKVRDFVPVDLGKIAPKAPERPVPAPAKPEARIAALKVDTKADSKADSKAGAAAITKPNVKNDAKAEAKGKEKKPAEPKNPARYWVQVATGGNVAALQFDWRKMVKANTALFGKQEAWTSPWGKTRRLVVGPFTDQKAAKAFEAAFKKAGGDGFVWQSADGTLVEKLTGE